MNSDWRETKLESFLRVVEPYFAINLCRVIPSFPAFKRMFLLRGMKKSFSCRRVFGRVPNKDVELCLVLSCRKSSRVVVRVVTVTNFDQRSIQVSTT